MIAAHTTGGVVAGTSEGAVSVRGLVVGSTALGSVELREASTSGATKLNLVNVPAGPVLVPGAGLAFGGAVVAVLTGATATVFFEDES